MRATALLSVILVLAGRGEAAPVVFLPGTGGSTLRFADSGQLYWLDEDILGREVLLRGRLNADHATPDRPIVAGGGPRPGVPRGAAAGQGPARSPDPKR